MQMFILYLFIFYVRRLVFTKETENSCMAAGTETLWMYYESTIVQSELQDSSGSGCNWGCCCVDMTRALTSLSHLPVASVTVPCWLASSGLIASVIASVITTWQKRKPNESTPKDHTRFPIVRYLLNRKKKNQKSNISFCVTKLKWIICESQKQQYLNYLFV